MLRLVFEGRNCIGGPVRKRHRGLFLKSKSMDERLKALRSNLIKKKHPCFTSGQSQTFIDLDISDDGVKYACVCCSICRRVIVDELNNGD